MAVQFTGKDGPTPGDGMKHFYVSAVDESNGVVSKHWILAGPYEQHADALAQVGAVSAIGCKNNPRAVWYAFGTCGSAEPIKTPLGADWTPAKSYGKYG